MDEQGVVQSAALYCGSDPPFDCKDIRRNTRRLGFFPFGCAIELINCLSLPTTRRQ